MRKFALLLLIIICMAIPGFAVAGPYLVCDPYPTSTPQPTEFRITYGPTTIVSPAVTQQDGSKRLYWDLAPLLPGTYNISVVAVRMDPLWGEEVSSAVPFSFTKPVPGSPSAPANIRLLK